MSTPYDARAVTVLRGLEAVRRRPAMYVGSTGPAGILHLAAEVVQNAIDEALSGHGRHVEVTIHADGAIEVRDEGRGIPVDAHPSTGRPAAEVVLTTLHAGGKFDERAYLAPGGMHGVGVSCVNALSEELLLEVCRDGGRWQQRYRRGVPVADLERVGNATGTGTRIWFRPDREVFGSAELPADTLDNELRAQAFLCAGLRVVVDDRRRGVVAEHHYSTGLSGFVAELDAGRAPVHGDPIRVTGHHQGVEVDVALHWTWAFHEELRGYVNHVATPRGGTHVEGLKAALTRVVEAVAREGGLLGEAESIAGWDVREGLTAAVSIRLRDAAFEGQTKAALSSPGAAEAVERVVAEGLRAHFAAHPDHAARVVGRAIESSRARLAARRASERARYRRVDLRPDREVYRQQFGIRSKNWHDSARWITDQALLGAHGGLAQVPPDTVALDACCGSGVVGASFRGKVARVVGLDLTPQMAELARQRLDEVVLGDVYEIPFADESFGLVCNREVLHLLPHPERPVAEFFRVLKPGGQLVVGQLVPYGAVDAPWMFRVLKKKQPLFFNNFLAEDVEALLAGAGFVNITSTEVIQWEDIDTWIDTWETPGVQRHQIRDLYVHAPAEVRAVHPFELSAEGRIMDAWRWVVFSAFKA